MGLKDTIMADIKSAMKDKDQVRVSALRFLNSAIKNREIELRPNEITEQEVISVIKKSIKQRKESIEQYQAANRDDLVQSETTEMKILEQYLPQQLSKEQTEVLVAQVIREIGATTIKDMGRVMKEVVARSSGNADNKIVSELVKAKLQPS